MRSTGITPIISRMERICTFLCSIALLLLALYLSVGTFGLLSPSRMNMTGGIAPACSMLGHDGSVCPMSIADHLTSWQSLFRALSKARPLAAALFGFVTATAFALSFLAIAALVTRFKRGNAPPGTACNLYQQLVSLGILQPIYYEDRW